MTRTVLTTILILISTLAFADQKAADGCAAGLSPDAKLIYDASAPGFATAPDPRAEVKSQVQQLVLQGKIERSAARGNAMSAGGCLRKLR